MKSGFDQVLKSYGVNVINDKSDPLYSKGISISPEEIMSDVEQRAIQGIRGGDKDDARQLIENNYHLVARIAKKYANSRMELDDLMSVGCIGLMKAVTSYRPEAGRLTTYALRCIENEILMTLRSSKMNKNSLSLSKPLSSDREEKELILLDVLGTEQEAMPAKTQQNSKSESAIRLVDNVLSERERRVVVLRYGLQDGIFRSQIEVADALGISRSYVSRIEKTAFQKLRDAYDSYDHVKG